MRSWEHEAACLDVDPDVFFDEEDPGPAQALCASCPVRVECLEQCLEDEAHIPSSLLFGVFGGTTPEDRARMRHSTDRQESA